MDKLKSKAVILAGGLGTRMWPLSQPNCPKQFLPLLPDGQTSLQAVVQTLEGSLGYRDLWVVAPLSLIDKVIQCVPKLPKENLIVEPVGRDSGPAIVWSTMELVRKFGNKIVVSFHPSDHVINDRIKFGAVMSAARSFVHRKQSMVLVCSPIEHASPLMGYVEHDELLLDMADYRVYSVKHFIEKPTTELAYAFFASGKHHWNTGIFVSNGQVLLDEIRRYMPQVFDQLNQEGVQAFRNIPRFKVEDTLFIETTKLLMITADFGWRDIGN